MDQRNKNHKIVIEVIDGELHAYTEAGNTDVLAVLSAYSIELAKEMELDKDGYFRLLKKIWDTMEI
ncbi:hypothetical protein [Enterococcus viikkiensis]|uniref:hypothetical protein n=1 Tax=Enterococcus viikkiensis TaxID=930854 RepID=UPI0010F4C4C6|nr:hypothetical protein [Enterococcus viikkiensis]